MANNPRKFSEKIALLNQKQAECNSEFEKILQEVSGAIKVSDSLSLVWLGARPDRQSLKDNAFKVWI